ncbi:unnamed protein product [Soboliphyme baturini]|uniref:ATP synthase subunit beta, mitochondrial n=1 Tax=Soboliphyme baturini TaxID=241478 RepID=A0A183J3Y3_9BILA|nr:unnamed protein product [Soboliphyme baturini]
MRRDCFLRPPERVAIIACTCMPVENRVTKQRSVLALPVLRKVHIVPVPQAVAYSSVGARSDVTTLARGRNLSEVSSKFSHGFVKDHIRPIAGPKLGLPDFVPYGN